MDVEDVPMMLRAGFAAFTHHVHIAIQLPHSTLFFKCFTLIFVASTHIHIGTHCLQVAHF